MTINDDHPLLLHNLKAVTDTDLYNRSSISIFEGAGFNGAKSRPFNYTAAVAQFRSWVYAAAMLNSQAVASVPLRLYVRGGRAAKGKFHVDGRECLWRTRPVSKARRQWLTDGPSMSVRRKLLDFDDYEEVTEEHPLLTLLNNVNPWFNGFDLTALRILYGELTGNAYLLKVHGDGEGNPPTELWPMPSQWMWIKPSRMNWIDGYVYGKSTLEETTFETDEVIHFRRPNPGDLHYGLGKVEAGWGAVSINESNHAMDLALADNHARPDYLIIVKGGTDATLDRIEQGFRTKLRGPRKGGKGLAVSGELDVRPLNFPPKDLVGRDDVVEEIAAVFGVPVSMLKANDPNLASAKSGYAMWRETTILPLCRLDEQTLNQNLVPLFGDAYCLAYDNPVPSDKDFELRRSQAFVAGGIQTANEARAKEGMEPIEDANADKLLVNGVPIGGGVPGVSLTLNQPQGVAPAAPPESDLEKPGAAQDIQTTEATVLNGAQITSAKDIVLAVTEGKLPRDSGVAMLEAFFNLTPEKAEAIMASAGKAEVPTTPNPNPKAEVANDGNADVPAGDGDGGGGDVLPEGAAATDKASEAGAGLSAERPGGKVKAAEGLAIIGAAAAVVDTGHAGAAHAEADGGLGEQGVRIISLKAIANGCGSLECDCHAEPVTLLKSWERYRTKAAADDTAREHEPENPLLVFARKMDAIFGRQRDAVIGVLQREKSVKEAKPDVRRKLNAAIKAFDSDIDAAIKPFVTTMAGVGGNVGAAAVHAHSPDASGVFNVTNPEVRKFLDEYTVELRDSIQGYTGDAISETVGKVLDDGGSPADLARTLREDASAAGGSLSPARSEAIARTESARAYVEGERAAWKASGVVEGKEWLLAPDACDFCKELARQFNGKNVGLDQPFFKKGSLLTAGGQTMVLDYSDVQGPPLHPHDRCDLVPVFKEIPDA